MWKQLLYITSLISQAAISGKLLGDHICQEEERYNVNVTEYYIRNATVRNYQWCLNVPPRCSFYTNKKLNDTRLVEKTLTRILESCCPGFVIKDNKCNKACPDCLNGVCEDGECLCHAGYKGKNCNEECDSYSWGSDCQNICMCYKGVCNAKDGTCTCYHGWKGDGCYEKCDDGFFGEQCQERCDCGEDAPCDSVTGACITTMEVYTESGSTLGVTMSKQEDTTTKSSFSEIITTTWSSTPLSSTTEASVAETLQTEITEKEIPTTTTSTTPPTTTFIISTPSPPQWIAQPETEIIPTVFVTTLPSTSEEKNYLVVDEAHDMINDLNGNNSKSNSNNDDGLFNGISVFSAFLAIVVLIVALLIITKHIRKRKSKMNNEVETKNCGSAGTNNNVGVSTVAVYTHSIFHTPLPDPPTFDNPTYATSTSPENPTTNTNESRTFQARVVCNMNFHNQTTKETKDYTYDHPPSTGSYRAASIPEPEIELCFSKSEPVYDEIPQRPSPQVCESTLTSPNTSYALYMNTCGKTRF